MACMDVLLIHSLLVCVIRCLNSRRYIYIACIVAISRCPSETFCQCLADLRPVLCLLGRTRSVSLHWTLSVDCVALHAHHRHRPARRSDGVQVAWTSTRQHGRHLESRPAGATSTVRRHCSAVSRTKRCVMHSTRRTGGRRWVVSESPRELSLLLQITNVSCC